MYSITCVHESRYRSRNHSRYRHRASQVEFAGRRHRYGGRAQGATAGECKHARALLIPARLWRRVARASSRHMTMEPQHQVWRRPVCYDYEYPLDLIPPF